MVTGVNVSALEGQIQQARAQLNDWVSCVSANTPKGQAEIQKFSGEIGADQQKIALARQSQADSSASATHQSPNSRLGVSVDAWA